VWYLLENGAAKDEGDEQGRTPIFHASINGHRLVVRELLQARAVTKRGLQQKAYRELQQMAKQTGACKANIKFADMIECLTQFHLARPAPAHAASQNGQTDELVLFLDKRADVNLAANNGTTPLFMASCRGYADTVSLLLENGADVNLAHKSGITPLYQAALLGHTEVLVLLLENGADVNLAKNDGSTPLILAASKGRAEMVSLLLESGADQTAVAGPPAGLKQVIPAAMNVTTRNMNI
jgi:ankyrin repeat protein